jgi:hypothetical protein
MARSVPGSLALFFFIQNLASGLLDDLAGESFNQGLLPVSDKLGVQSLSD